MCGIVQSPAQLHQQVVAFTGKTARASAHLNRGRIVVELRLRKLCRRVVGVVDALGSGVNVAQRLTQQQRRDGDGAHGEMARGAKHGIEKDRHKSAIKAIHSRQTREKRVRHALWHDHESDGHAGDKIHQQVLFQLHSMRRVLACGVGGNAESTTDTLCQRVLQDVTVVANRSPAPRQ